MRILVTGIAGFIGFHTAKRLLECGHTVIGIDSINDYYNTELKYDRLSELGIDKEAAVVFGLHSDSSKYFERCIFIRMKLEERSALPQLFASQDIDVVCNLAAQAGVRYSLENPMAYVDSNVVGFVNLLECCRHFKVKHFVYASSSSVYGQSIEVPFSEDQIVDSPISLYAATKRSNELMAYTYSHLYGIPTTGLRFFTVYGPWGRPDMALFLFTKAILAGDPINVFNSGDLERDFTYIDDIIEGLSKVIETDFEILKSARRQYNIYNIGKGESVRLLDFIDELEKQLGIEARKIMLPMQPGDVNRTWASSDNLMNDYGYFPQTTISEGVKHFITWYREYFEIN